MVDTYRGVKEASQGEWALKRANLVLFRESWVFWQSPHYIDYCRATASPAELKVPAKCVVQRVRHETFVPKKPSDFPQQNHYMLKELFDNARKNAHVPKRNSELMEQMHLFLNEMYSNAKKNAHVPVRNSQLIEEMHVFLKQMHTANEKNADVPRINRELMQSIQAKQ